jgi:hypothetical protein
MQEYNLVPCAAMRTGGRRGGSSAPGTRERWDSSPLGPDGRRKSGHATGQRHWTTKYINMKSTTVYVPSSELGLSQPLSRQRVCPSPQNRGGGGHTRTLRRLEKKLSTLPTLCTEHSDRHLQCLKRHGLADKH